MSKNEIVIQEKPEGRREPAKKAPAQGKSEPVLNLKTFYLT